MFFAMNVWLVIRTTARRAAGSNAARIVGSLRWIARVLSRTRAPAVGASQRRKKIPSQARRNVLRAMSPPRPTRFRTSPKLSRPTCARSTLRRNREGFTFNLGNVIVRARLDIDPITAQATVTTDPTGPYAIPHILDGIPLQIKHVNVTIDRPGFAFNPTNCNPLTLTGNIQSTTATTIPVSVPFQITNCATLKFNPKSLLTQQELPIPMGQEHHSM
jgi:hypothetical protein